MAAEAQAEELWREAGARTASEMRAILIGRMRRRVGMGTVQAMARHRLARVPYVGVSRAFGHRASRARWSINRWAVKPTRREHASSVSESEDRDALCCAWLFVNSSAP